jgi:hypothetical protein
MTVTVRNPTSDNPTQTMITTGLYPNRNVRQRRRTTPGRRGHASVASLARYTRVSPDALTRWQARRDPAGAADQARCT